MTLILDAGGVSALAGHRARLMELHRHGLWAAQVPSVVLTESLTGDHRGDFHANRLPAGSCAGHAGAQTVGRRVTAAGRLYVPEVPTRCARRGRGWR
jgi:hypothetical protein